MGFPEITAAKRIERLLPSKGKIRMVLDTDTFNEIDDQFAVLYALKSMDRLNVEALYAAPFYNNLSSGPNDGMEKSYQELLKIMKLVDRSPERYVYRGSTQYLPGKDLPVESEAAKNLVERAMASTKDDPLYVAAIGAITNVASAILMEPKIIENIVVVWLGGHNLSWPSTKEFNLQQDIHASRLILDCGVPLVLIPCMGVASHLLTTLSEVREHIKGSPIGDYLCETFENCHPDHYAYSRVIWDIATIGYLLNDNWVHSSLIPSPILTDQFTWSFDSSRHMIRCASYINRDDIFRDMFRKLSAK